MFSKEGTDKDSQNLDKISLMAKDLDELYKYISLKNIYNKYGK